MNKKILVAIIIAIISCTTFYVMLGLKLNKSDEIAEYVTKRDMTFVVTNSIALNDKYGTLYLIHTKFRLVNTNMEITLVGYIKWYFFI